MAKFIVMDVDGTLTDRKIYMGANEELFKSFDVKDGYAIKGMLTEILDEQRKKGKMSYSYKGCAYIGDDILDLQCMKPIKNAGGLIGCPVDAVREIKEISDYGCSKNGGDGAVREFVEWVISFEKTNEPFTKQSLVEDNTKL